VELDDLKDNFMLEATELLDEAEDALLEFDNGGSFQDSYNKVFRSFHSLKGASGMFGLDILQEHLHKLETLLDGVEDNFPKGAVDYFLSGIDQARHFFDDGKIEFEHVTSFDESSQANVVPKTEVTKEERKEKIADHKNEKEFIYVVDDEQLILDLIADCLVDAGYKVRTFLDGDEVLEAVSADTPDIIVSDINMPNLDGLSMIKKLKEIDINTPVVFVSAYVTKEAVMTGLESGAHYFLEKPFDEKYLISLVASICKELRTKKLLNNSVDYILYQFANHEELLRKHGKEKELDLMRNEIKNILNLRKNIA
jgi:DNA-binding response OmpR family regulator/HPt (histidine-containing phosphotransfer) domain-containing protein